jgi:colanic acid biosynthesis protein WcaH
MILPHAEFAAVVRHAPLVSIDLVVRNRRGEVLVGLRRNRPALGSWFVPGGRIVKAERIADAFKRIVRAELGIVHRIEDAAFLGVFEHIYADNFSGDPAFGTHYVVLGYALLTDPASLALPSDQHDDYRWLPEPILVGDPNVHEYTKAYFRPAV